MAIETRTLVIGFGANTTNFSEGIKRVKGELGYLNTDLLKNKEQLKLVTDEYKSVQKALNSLASEMKQSNGGTEEQKSKYASLSSTLDALSIKIGKYKADQTQIKTQVSLANKELREQEQGLRGISDESNKASKTIANLGTAFKALLMGYTGKKLFDYLIGSNAELEQYLTSFEVMLGDAGKAKNLMNDLVGFAAKSPLELTDTTKSTQLLMNYGIQADNVIEKMTQLGNLSLGNADKLNRVSLAYGQMLAKGKVTGEELRQMTEAGVPLLQTLADTIGVSTANLQKMISAGEVGIPELDQAITSLTTGNGKFAGMMEKQAQTMSGMLSTLKDEFAQFGRDTGEEGFGAVKDTIKDVLEEIQKARESGDLTRLSNEIGQSVNFAIKSFVGAIKTIWEYRDVIASAATATVAFKSAMMIQNVISTTSKAISDFKKATDAATVSQGMLNTVMAASPWMVVAALAAACAAAITLMALNSDNATGRLSALNDEMESAKTSAQGMIDTGNGEIAVLESKVKMYEELRTTANRTVEQEQALKQIALELQEILPSSISLIDSETGAYLSQAGAIQQVIDKKKAEILLKAKETEFEQAVTNKSQLEDEVKRAEEALKKAEAQDARIYNNFKSQMARGGADPNTTGLNTDLANKNLSEAKRMLDEAIDVEKEYAKMFEDFYSKYPSTGTTTGNGDGSQDDLSGSKDNPLVTKSKKAYDNLKFLRDADLISEEEYLEELTTLRNQAKSIDEDLYRKYYLEVYNIQKSANEKMLAEEQKTASELEKTRKTELSNWLKSSKSAYDDYYNARIKRINDEVAAEEKRISRLISNIDAEIKARQRLKEETDANKQIDAVKAKLQYSQLDEFSRMELEKELARLQSDKADREWLNSKEDEKESLRNQLSRYKDIADQQKEMFAQEKEQMHEMFDFIGENFNSLQELQTSGIQGVFGLIQTKTTETADMYSTVVGQKVNETFDYAVARAKEAISELQNAVSYAKQQASSIIATANKAAENAKKIITVNNNANVNVTNPNLTANQVSNKVANALYSSAMELR